MPTAVFFHNPAKFASAAQLLAATANDASHRKTLIRSIVTHHPFFASENHLFRMTLPFTTKKPPPKPLPSNNLRGVVGLVIL